GCQRRDAGPLLPRHLRPDGACRARPRGLQSLRGARKPGRVARVPHGAPGLDGGDRGGARLAACAIRRAMTGLTIITDTIRVSTRGDAEMVDLTAQVAEVV